MKGPCLCGDPYCPSCGNPGLAEKEEMEERFLETLDKYNLSKVEYEVVLTVGLAAVEAHRQARREERRDEENIF